MAWFLAVVSVVGLGGAAIASAATSSSRADTRGADATAVRVASVRLSESQIHDSDQAGADAEQTWTAASVGGTDVLSKSPAGWGGVLAPIGVAIDALNAVACPGALPSAAGHNAVVCVTVLSGSASYGSTGRYYRRDAAGSLASVTALDASGGKTTGADLAVAPSSAYGEGGGRFAGCIGFTGSSAALLSGGYAVNGNGLHPISRGHTESASAAQCNGES